MSAITIISTAMGTPSSPAFDRGTAAARGLAEAGAVSLGLAPFIAHAQTSRDLNFEIRVVRFMCSMLAARALFPPRLGSARSSNLRSMPIINSSKLMPASGTSMEDSGPRFPPMDLRRQIEVPRIKNHS